MARLSRRSFGAILAAAGPTAAALDAQQNPTTEAAGKFRRTLAPETRAFEGTLEFTRQSVAPRAEPFPMAQVRLLPNSVYHDAQEWNRGYMERLTADRLLYTFRANAGLPVGSAKPLGGWEQPENGQRPTELRGHLASHLLAATTQLATSGYQEAQATSDHLVAATDTS